MAEYLCKADCIYKKRLYIEGERSFFNEAPNEHFAIVGKADKVFAMETAKAGELRKYAGEKGIDLSQFRKNTSADVLREYLREKGL